MRDEDGSERAREMSSCNSRTMFSTMICTYVPMICSSIFNATHRSR